MYFIPSSGATRHLPPKGKVLKLPNKLKFDILYRLRKIYNLGADKRGKVCYNTKRYTIY